MKKGILILSIILCVSALGIFFLKTSIPKNIKNDINRLSGQSAHLVFKHSDEHLKNKMDSKLFETLIETEKAKGLTPSAEKADDKWFVNIGEALKLIYEKDGEIYRLSGMERINEKGQVEDTLEIASVETCKRQSESLVASLLSRDDLESLDGINTQYIQSLKAFVMANLQGHYAFNSSLIFNEINVIDDNYYEVSFNLCDNEGHEHKNAVKMLFDKNDPRQITGLKIEGVCHLEDVIPSEMKTALLSASNEAHEDLTEENFKYLKTTIREDQLYVKLVFEKEKSKKNTLIVIDYKVLPEGHFEELVVSECPVTLPKETLKPLVTKPDMLKASKNEVWYKSVADEQNGLYFDHYYKLVNQVPSEIVIRVRNSQHKVIETITTPYLYKDYIWI